jgi:hypothetical protein
VNGLLSLITEPQEEGRVKGQQDASSIEAEVRNTNSLGKGDFMRVGAIDMHCVQYGACAQRTLPVPISVREDTER